MVCNDGERRKLKKVLVFLLTLHPKHYVITNEFRTLCKFFDVERFLDETSNSLIGKGFIKDTEVYTERLLAELLYHFYEEISSEFTEFVMRFVINLAVFSNVNYDEKETENDIRCRLLKYGFTHDEVFGNNETISPTSEQIENSIPTMAVPEAPKNPLSNNIFIVHGHDTAMRDAVSIYIHKLGLTPIILSEEASGGSKTLIEKLEGYKDIGYAIVCLSPDDMGCEYLTKEEQMKGFDLMTRARQNVIFELGYFQGCLGRENVCPLNKQVQELPSDYTGVVWVNFDDNGAWKLKLVRELTKAGFSIDSKRV